jgi:hypothetical protein
VRSNVARASRTLHQVERSYRTTRPRLMGCGSLGVGLTGRSLHPGSVLETARVPGSRGRTARLAHTSHNRTAPQTATRSPIDSLVPMRLSLRSRRIAAHGSLSLTVRSSTVGPEVRRALVHSLRSFTKTSHGSSRALPFGRSRDGVHRKEEVRSSSRRNFSERKHSFSERFQLYDGRTQ